LGPHTANPPPPGRGQHVAVVTETDRNITTGLLAHIQHRSAVSQIKDCIIYVFITTQLRQPIITIVAPAYNRAYKIKHNSVRIQAILNITSYHDSSCALLVNADILTGTLLRRASYIIGNRVIGVPFLAGAGDLSLSLFSIVSRPALGPTQSIF
jgi:hypothetical protein